MRRWIIYMWIEGHNQSQSTARGEVMALSECDAIHEAKRKYKGRYRYFSAEPARGGIL